MEEDLLQLMALIRDERCCIVFATIQGRWYRDLSDCGRKERREVYPRAHGKWIETGFIADTMFHRHDDDLSEIDRGASPNSHD
jgi:hypothetical protein